MRLALEQPVGAHGREFVAELERERPVLIKDELELEGNVGELVQEVGRLLDVGFAAPGSCLVEPAGQDRRGSLLGLADSRTHLLFVFCVCLGECGVDDPLALFLDPRLRFVAEFGSNEDVLSRNAGSVLKTSDSESEE